MASFLQSKKFPAISLTIEIRIRLLPPACRFSEYGSGKPFYGFFKHCNIPRMQLPGSANGIITPVPNESHDFSDKGFCRCRFNRKIIAVTSHAQNIILSSFNESVDDIFVFSTTINNNIPPEERFGHSLSHNNEILIPKDRIHGITLHFVQFHQVSS